MPKEVDEYELIPLSPLRKLEKRIAELELSGVNTKEFFQEFVDIVKMNQQLVDEVIRANNALRVELSRLPGKIEEMTKNLTELLSYIKAAAIEEISPTSSESFKIMPEKMDKLIELNKKIVESNETLTSLMETIEKRMKPTMTIRKSVPSPKPMLVKSS